MLRSIIKIVTRIITVIAIVFSPISLLVTWPAQAQPPAYQGGPQAGFVGQPLSGPAPLEVTFANNSTNANRYEWDFGDGTSDAVISPTHTYAAGGVYTVSLAAGDGVVTDTLVRTAYISVLAPVAPQADFSGSPLSGTAPLTVTFSNSSTAASNFTWNFGDNSQLLIANNQLPITHTYSQAGLYTVTLSAGDGVVTGSLSRANYVTVNAPPGPTPSTDVGQYVVLGLNSVQFSQGSDLYSGHVGAQNASPGPVLDSGAEVTIGQGVAFHNPASAIAGDTVKLKSGASVFDLFALDLNAAANADYGQVSSVFSPPLVSNWPAWPEISPGPANYDVAQGGSLELAAGAYGQIKLRKKASLTLSGGVYHLANLNIGDQSQVRVTAPAEIRIANRLEPGQGATIAPAEGSGLDATDLALFVGGINGNTGNLGATPKAAVVGQSNLVTATIYAPNGTLWLKQGSQARGAFIGRDVKIGDNAQLFLENAFAGGYQSPSAPLPPPPPPTPPSDVGDYAVLGLSSVWLRQGSDLYSGHVGAQNASPGPVLDSGAEVTIGQGVAFHDPASAIAGDTVKLKLGAGVFDVFYNDLDQAANAGYDQLVSPLSLPAVTNLPPFLAASPGPANYDVAQDDSLALAAGAYGQIKLRKKAGLTLSGGVYHLANLDLGDQSQVRVTAPTEIRIANRLEPGQGATIAPAEGSGLDATDLALFVGGINGNTGNLGATPKAAVVGQSNLVTATIYAPNGTLWLKQGSQARGAFIGQDVKIGYNVQIWLENAFAGGYQSPSAVVAGFSAAPLSGLTPLTVTFSNTSISATTFVWNFGDGTTVITNQLAVISHTYLTAGVYTVSLAAGDGVVSDTLTRTAYIAVSDPVRADFSGFPRTGVAPLPVQFFDSSTNAATLQWNFGDGSSSSAMNPSHTYTQAGLYSIRLTANGPGGSDSLTRTAYITVTAPPSVADFAATPLSGLAPLTVTFSNSSSNATTFVWNFGDGTTSPLEGGIEGGLTISHTYTQAGLYTVSLVAGNGLVSDTLTRTAYIAVSEPVAANFAAFPLNGSIPLLVQFLNNSTNANSFQWVFGDGAGSSQASPSHTYAVAGVYTVSLTASNGVVSHTLSRSEYLTVSADQAITGLSAHNDSPTVLSDTTSLTATITAGTNVSYDWTFGDGSSGNGPQVSHIYPTVGVYTAAVTATNSVGQMMSQIVVTIIDEAINGLAMVNNGPTVVSQTTTLTATITAGTNVTYTWNFGDGTTTTSLLVGGTEGGPITTTHAYQVAGVYTAVVTAGNSVNLVTATMAVTVISPARLTISKIAPVAVMAGELITYTLLVTNEGQAQATNLVITDALPGGASYITGGLKVGQVVSWAVAGLTGGSSLSCTFSVTAATDITNANYAVAATGSLSATGQVSITTVVYQPVAANFSANPLTGTVPLTVIFSNTTSGEATDFRWNFGDGTTRTLTTTLGVGEALTTSHTYTTNGVYTVSLNASGPGGSQTLTKTDYISVSELVRDWREITTTTTTLSVTGEHALAYDSSRNRVILYGGNTDGWPYEDTTWEFDGSDWISITTSSPPARYGAQMAYVASPLAGGTEGGLYLFGGSDETDTAFNQTWHYTNSVWSQVAITGSVPASRTYHSLGQATSPLSGGIEGGLYLFGGNDHETYFNDLWQYQNGGWSQITPTGNKPSARTLAAMTYASPPLGGIEGGLLLFGGRSPTGSLLADLWAFDLATESWTLLDDGEGGNGPPPRMAHSLTYDPATGNAVLAGGAADEGDTLLSDTWHYQAGQGWTEANPATPLPPRAYHQAIYTDNAIILFSNGEGWRYE